MKRKIVVGVLLVVLVGALIGYRLYSKRVANYAAERPDFTLSATELLAAFEADTAAASRRYADKVIRVSGTVRSLDSSAVVLGEEGNPSDVVVGLDDRHLDGLAGLRPGATAVLQGRFSGYQKASADDLLSALGTTVKIDYAGVKQNP